MTRPPLPLGDVAEILLGTGIPPSGEWHPDGRRALPDRSPGWILDQPHETTVEVSWHTLRKGTRSTEGALRQCAAALERGGLSVQRLFTEHGFFWLDVRRPPAHPPGSNPPPPAR